MLDMDEILADQAKAKKEEEKDSRISIIKRMPSFMMKKELSKNPSFFKKMFSMRSMDKIFVDDDSQDSGSNMGTEDGEQSQLATIQESKQLEDDEETPAPAEVVELDSKYPYIDPPMPNIGQPVDMDRLITRNKKAEFGLEKLMEMVTRDADASMKETVGLPVADGFDRISVTEEQSARISKVRTTKGIDNTVQRNLQQIQKALNYRKSAIIMMNSNYSHQLVRLIEPIYVQEARTIVQRTGDLGAPKHNTT